MSLARKTQILFCGNAVSSPANVIAEFGSLAAAAPIFSADPAVIMSLTAWLTGWSAATIAEGSPPQPVPPLQDMNALFYVAFYQLQYLLDRGIPEYDSGTTYGQYSFCQETGVVYQSKVGSNTGNDPSTHPSQWQNYGALFDAAGAAAAAQAAAASDATTKANAAQAAAEAASDPSGTAAAAVAALSPQLVNAWVVFNGTVGGISSGVNVASCVRTGVGQYAITFTTPLGPSPGCIGTSAGGLCVVIAAGSSGFNVATLGLVSGVFIPQDYSYNTFAFTG